MKRRDFLKATAIAASAVSAGPIIGNMAYGAGTKSKVVIAKDDQCCPNKTADKARITAMVDNCIMRLTGATDKAAAYKAIFPKAITSSTKVVIKYNNNYDITKTTPSPSYPSVYSALKEGLVAAGISSSNIIAFGGTGTPASSNPQVKIGTATFRIQDDLMKCDYFINLAACWAMATQYPSGVTMSQKNMMSAVGGGSYSVFHSLFTDATNPSLAVLNSQATFKDKQVLVVLDGIGINADTGPGIMAASNKIANTIFASKDMVAADYQGIQLLKANGLSADREANALKVCELSAKAPYNLGTNEPANMEIVNISPPYTTSVEWSGKLPEQVGLKVTMSRIGTRPNVVFQTERNTSSPELAIFTVNGAKIWSGPGLEWNGETLSGGVARGGTYLFALKVSGKYVRGKISIA